MNKIFAVFLIGLAVFLSGCLQGNDNNQLVGNDRDSYGCIPSAGYSWCEAKQKCLRPWEESCEAAPAPITGELDLLVSDAEADINDFASLDITFEKARVFSKDENGQERVIEVDINGSTVDLTTVVGEIAVPLVKIDLNAGSYGKIELSVLSIDAVLKDGNAAEVKVPSDSLKIQKDFEIDENSTTKFVFDIQVVKKGQGNEYNLLPVIEKSGTPGKDLNEPVTEIPAKKNIRQLAREFCGQENISEVLLCGDYVKVVSSLQAGGTTFYQFSSETRSLDEGIPCQVMSSDSLTPECRQLYDMNCSDRKVC